MATTHSNHPRRTLLLTGASRGIGHATVKRFSAAGWRVITCSRHGFPENCPWEAGPEDHIQIDLADQDSTIEAIAEIKRRLEGGAVTVWAISQDSPEHTAMFNREFGISLPPLFDPEDEFFPVSEAYQIAFVPTLFVIEQDGRISRASAGFNRKEFEEIAEHLSAAAGRAAVSLFAADENVPLVVPGCGGKN